MYTVQQPQARDVNFQNKNINQPEESLWGRASYILAGIAVSSFAIYRMHSVYSQISNGTYNYDITPYDIGCAPIMGAALICRGIYGPIPTMDSRVVNNRYEYGV